MFLDELFKDECDHSGEKKCVDNFKSRVLFEKRKFELSIFTFDEPMIDVLTMSFKNFKLTKALKISSKMNLCVWMNQLEMLWLVTHLPRK